METTDSQSKRGKKMDIAALPERRLEPSEAEKCEECGASFWPNWPEKDEPEIVCWNCAYLSMSE